MKNKTISSNEINTKVGSREYYIRNMLKAEALNCGIDHQLQKALELSVARTIYIPQIDKMVQIDPIFIDASKPWEQVDSEGQTIKGVGVYHWGPYEIPLYLSSPDYKFQKQGLDSLMSLTGTSLDKGRALKAWDTSEPIANDGTESPVKIYRPQKLSMAEATGRNSGGQTPTGQGVSPIGNELNHSEANGGGGMVKQFNKDGVPANPPHGVDPGGPSPIYTEKTPSRTESNIEESPVDTPPPKSEKPKRLKTSEKKFLETRSEEKVVVNNSVDVRGIRPPGGKETDEIWENHED